MQHLRRVCGHLQDKTLPYTESNIKQVSYKKVCQSQVGYSRRCLIFAEFKGSIAYCIFIMAKNN